MTRPVATTGRHRVACKATDGSAVRDGAILTRPEWRGDESGPGSVPSLPSSPVRWRLALRVWEWKGSECHQLRRRRKPSRQSFYETVSGPRIATADCTGTGSTTGA